MRAKSNSPSPAQRQVQAGAARKQIPINNSSIDQMHLVKTVDTSRAAADLFELPGLLRTQHDVKPMPTPTSSTAAK